MAKQKIESVEVELQLFAQQFRKEMLAVKTQLKRFEKGAERASKEVSGLRQSFTKVGQAIAAVDGPLGGISSRFTSFSSLITTGTVAATAFGAAVASAGALAFKAAQQYGEAEHQLLKLRGILNATGHTARFSAEQLQEQARTLARDTLTSTQAVVEAQSILASFGVVSGKQFTRLIELSQDLAASGIGTLRDSVIKLGKALKDPVSKLGELQEGGTITRGQMEKLKEEFIRTGDRGKLTADIIELIHERVGGAGKAEAGGLVGALDTLGENFSVFLATLGEFTGVGEASKVVITEIANGFRALSETMKPTEESLRNDIKALEENLSTGTTNVLNDITELAAGIPIFGAGISSFMLTYRAALGDLGESPKESLKRLRKELKEFQSEQGNAGVTNQLLADAEDRIAELEAKLKTLPSTKNMFGDEQNPFILKIQAEINELQERRDVLLKRQIKQQGEIVKAKEREKQLEKEQVEAAKKDRDDYFNSRRSMLDRFHNQALKSEQDLIKSRSSLDADALMEQERIRLQHERDVSLKELDLFKEKLDKKRALEPEQLAQLTQAKLDIEKDYQNKLATLELDRQQKRVKSEQETQKILDRFRAEAAQSKIDAEKSNLNIDAMLAQELELLEFQKQQDLKELELLRQKLDAEGQLTKENRNRVQEAELAALEEHENAKTALARDYAQKRVDAEQETLDTLNRFRAEAAQSKIDAEKSKLRPDFDALLAEQQELLELQKQQDLKELELLRQKLEAEGQLTKENKEFLQEAELAALEEHENKKTALVRDHTQKRIEYEFGVIRSNIEALGEFAKISEQFSEKGSKDQKRFFAAQKAVSVAVAMLKLHEAISKANAESDIYTKALHIANAVSIGTSAISSIKKINVAHSGLERVPREMTMLVDRDERILAPRQNAKLEDFLDGAAKSPGMNIVVNNNAPGVEVEARQTEQGYEIQIENIVRRTISKDIGQGGGVDGILRNHYGLSRVGRIS